MGDSMSTIINATTTNGVVIQPDNSGSLVLQTNNGTTALTIDTSQNTTFAKSIILNGSTSGTVTVAAPAVSGTTTLTLPSTSGTVLTSASSFTSSQMPVGSIVQVLQTAKTDVFSTSSSSWTDWTGMSVTITPKSNTNKILVTLTSGVSNDTTNCFQYVKLVRGSTDIALGDTSGSATRCWIDGATGQGASQADIQKPLTGSFLDSPATTSATTYKLQVIRTLNGTAYFGRSSNTSDANRSSIPSVLTVMEVVA